MNYDPLLNATAMAFLLGSLFGGSVMAWICLHGGKGGRT